MNVHTSRMLLVGLLLLALAACGGAGVSLQSVQSATPERLAKMEAHLRQWVQQAPGDLDAAQALAHVLLRQKRAAQAEQFALQATDGNPFYGAYMVTLGEVYLAQKKRFRALTVLTHAIALDKDLLPAYVMLAAVQEQLGDRRKAIQSLNVGLRREPRYFAARYQLARLHYGAGNLDKAAAELEQAAKIRPEDRAGGLLNIQVLKAQGRFTYAEQLLAAALRKNPDDGELLYQQLDLHYQRQEWARAREILAKIKSTGGLKPRDELIQVGLLQSSGDPGAASSRLQQLLQAHPDYRPALEAQAGLSVLNGKPESALAQLRRLAEIAPLSSEGNYWRAVALFQLNRMVQGDQALADARISDAGYPRVRLLYIRRLMQRRRIVEASKLLKGYLKEFPADGEAALLEVDLLTLVGKYGSALAKLKNISDKPDPAPKLFARARIAYLSGASGDAASLSGELLKGARVSWREVYLHGAALRKLQRYGEAAAAIEPHLSNAEAGGKLHRLMAEIQILADRRGAAKITLKAGLALYAGDPGLIETMSRLTMDAGNWKEARVQLESAIGAPRPFRALFLERLRIVYRNLNEPKLARITLQRYLEETDPLKREAFTESDNSVLYGNTVPATGLTILPPVATTD